jgi:RNA polymerase-binding transcription factor DksA
MRKKEVIRRLKEQGTGIESGDVADVALDDAFDLVSSQLAQTESRELAQVELALERIRRGTYGQCGVCEAAIPMARLEALPYAVRCVKCEREAEKKRRAGVSEDRWSGMSAAEDDAEPNNPFMDHVADIF